MMMIIYVYKEDDSGDSDNAQNLIRYVAAVISDLYLK